MRCRTPGEGSGWPGVGPWAAARQAGSLGKWQVSHGNDVVAGEWSLQAPRRSGACRLGWAGPGPGGGWFALQAAVTSGCCGACGTPSSSSENAAPSRPPGTARVSPPCPDRGSWLTATAGRVLTAESVTLHGAAAEAEKAQPGPHGKSAQCRWPARDQAWCRNAPGLLQPSVACLSCGERSE